MLAQFQVNRVAVEDKEHIPFPQDEILRLPKRKWILRHAKKGGIGAEIGVFRGHFSSILAEELQPTRLYLVDPWRKLGETFGWGNNSPYTGFGKLTTQYALDDTIRHVERFKDVDVRIIEAMAADFFPALGEKLDWIYLDASHKYDHTYKELLMAEQALKEDGVIIGDDWAVNPAHQHHGVFRAVRDFCKNFPFEIVVAGPDGQWCVRRSTD